jgi:two-component system, OmpR family, sensor histidine kinase KdpD
MGVGAARWRQYLMAAGIVGLTSGLALVFRAQVQPTDVAMLYLLAIVAVASRYEQGAALLATVLGIAAFDFLFVPPYYTFAVREGAYFLTFGVMLAVALVMSRLTGRIRNQAAEALEREGRTAAVFAMSQDLGQCADRGAQVAVATSHLERAVEGTAVLMLLSEAEYRTQGSVWPAGRLPESVEVAVAAQWAYENGAPAGMGSGHCAEAESLVVPLQTPSHKLGLVIVTPEQGGTIRPTTLRTLTALADQAAIALDQAMWAERHKQAQLEIEAERLRIALLSSLSHDLRTPLGSIEGAASSLLHDADALSGEVKRDLVETIIEESRRMSRLVANLLDMVRVETGSLTVQKEWQPLEEPLGVALLRLEERLKPHPLEVRLPADLPMVPIDELLIEQVLINLLENAAKHTPPTTPITVSAWADGGAVVLEVADRGPGIPPGAEEIVFQKFYRARGADQSSGAGLGLAICRGIIAAHGGKIWALPGASGGAAFRFTLPLEGPGIPAIAPELAHS